MLIMCCGLEKNIYICILQFDHYIILVTECRDSATKDENSGWSFCDAEDKIVIV